VARESEEDAWRAIVENFGDRAEIEDEPFDSSVQSAIDPPPTPSSYDDERFVPPPPPPLPFVPRDRLIAWACLFGSPTILLVALVIGISLPPWLGYLLVSGFVGGFIYLVAKMPRGPADPWDDGARL
jgi:hypothetical protein